MKIHNQLLCLGGLLLLTAIALFQAGCDPASRKTFVSLGTAPVGGAFQPVGDAIASVLGDLNVQSQGTKGSQQNIRMLDKNEIQLGMSNAAISYHASRGTGGWDKKYDVRAIATLAPNVGLFVTKKDSGIKSIADLRGKRVTVGPAGAGFEMFLTPLFAAHGIKYDATRPEDTEFTPLNETYSAAVGLLGDGNADAAFLGGAIPTAAVTQACTSYDIFFIPYDAAARDKLIAEYSYFNPVTIPALNKDGQPTYRGQTEDFVAMNVGSMQLVTYATVDEELIYNITKTIWEKRAEITKQHPAGNAINEKNVARNVGTEFHPGAIRFYKEIGVWPQ
jgi:TRAP transporter TAXI family solute receptor